MLETSSEATGVLAWLAGIGAMVGLGQLFLSNEPITVRLVIGRAVVSGGLGAGAGIILLFVPAAPLIAQFGLAAGLASIGTSGLELLLQAWFKKKVPAVTPDE